MPAAAPTRPGSSRQDPPAPPETGEVYIVHGDDELAVAAELARLKADLGGDPAMAGVNTTTFSGAQVTMGELRHACDTIPFLGSLRLVVVRGLLARLAPPRKPRDQEPAQQEDPAWKRAYLAELLDYLPRLPRTTRLVFVDGERLDPSHRVLRFAVERGAQRGAYVKACPVPKEGELPGTVREMVHAHGGRIRPAAARLLAGLVGPDMRLLDSEIEKLLSYGEGREITEQEVELLVSQAREAVIFELTDAMARRATARALEIVHRLLEDGAEPLYILAMIARQVRILMQVGVLRSERCSQPEIVSRLGLHPFVAEKALAQVGGFSMAQLEAAHARLVATDWAIKKGEVEPPLALDLLVVELSR